MPSVKVVDHTGKSAGKADLDERVFGIEPHQAVLHQVVTAQLAARRAGTQSTKTRAEVRGGGAKPWKQKGTGRARAGSSRSPIWRGGGVALGPKPRSYKQRTPKKMIRLALHSALSDRAADDKVVVVDSWDFAEPSTSAARTMLEALGIEGRVLVVLGEDDVNAQKSFRNLPEVHTLLGRELNAYDILVADWVLFSNATLPTAPPNKRDKAAAAAAEAEPTDAEPTDAEPTDDGADDATDGSEEE